MQIVFQCNCCVGKLWSFRNDNLKLVLGEGEGKNILNQFTRSTLGVSVAWSLSTGPTKDVILMINLFIPGLNLSSEFKVFFYLSSWSIFKIVCGCWWCLLGRHLCKIHHFYKTITIENLSVCHLSTNETSPLLFWGEIALKV